MFNYDAQDRLCDTKTINNACVKIIVMGTGAPNVEAEAAIDAQAFIGKHGLQSVAGLQVEAHGSIYSVEDAIVQCPPFAKMITGLAVGLEGLPEENRTEIITKSIRTMAVDTPEIAADTQKKTII